MNSCEYDSLFELATLTQLKQLNYDQIILS